MDARKRERGHLRMGRDLLLTAVLLGLAPGLRAQIVRGRTVAETGAPVAGVYVSLLDSLDRRVAGTLSDAEGSFALRAAPIGTYTLSAEHIGYRREVSPPLVVRDGEPVERVLVMAVHALPLEGLHADGERVCEMPEGEGTVLARVWDEARKALEAARWTEDKELYRFRIRRYVQHLGPYGTDVRWERTWTDAGWWKHVFVSPLDPSGTGPFSFAEAGADSLAYHGPDAAVLLSERFLDSHCFRVMRDPGEVELVGMGFEPGPGSSGTGIEGTIWLDEGTSTLQRVDFRYVGLDLDEAPSDPGGRVEYAVLDNGTWVVTSWWIAAPEVELAPDPASLAGRRRRVLAGLRKTGAEVVEIRDAESVRVVRGTASVEGTVVDSTGSAPVVGATVRLTGTAKMAVTDAGGRFEIPGLAGGTYQVELDVPYLSELELAAPRRMVEVEGGERLRLDLRAPGVARALAATCAPGEDRPDDVLVGSVVEARSGMPLPGARVVLAWGPGPDAREELQAGELGLFRSCTVPTDAPVRAWSEMAGRLADTITVRVPEGGFADLVLRVPLVTDPASPAEPPTEEAAAPGMIVGRVVDAASGRPVVGAVVGLRDGGDGRPTGIQGQFVLRDVPPGIHLVTVEHLGYASAEDSVYLAPGQSLEVDLTVAERAIDLEGITVTVRARPVSARLAGLYQRLDQGRGLFVLRDEIERRGDPPVSALLQGRAGIRIRRNPGDGGGYVAYVRQGLQTGCPARVYVDGVPVRQPDIDQLLSVELEAVEVYRGAADVPAEFAGSDAQCGVVVLWTRGGGVPIPR